jgi:SPP1 family predicted phage head-tail adaptor
MAEVEKINLGDFDQLIKFKEPVKTKGGKSQIVTTYVEKARIYGDIEVSQAAEATLNENVISLDKITITTYYLTGINSKWVIEWLGEIYDIVSIRKSKQTIFMKIDAKKMLKNG